VNDDYHYSFMEGSHKPGSYALIRLVVEEEGEHCISVAQKDERCYRRSHGYEYSNCRIAVMKIDLEKSDIDEDGDNLEVDYLRGTQSWDRDTHLEFPDLKKGEYYIYVELDWHKNTTETSFCVTCYGQSNTTFLRDEKALFSKEMILANAFRSKAFKEMDGVTMTTMEAKGAPGIKKYKGFSEEGYGFIIIENDEQEYAYREKVNYKTFTGLKLLPPESGEGYETTVQPGGNKTIIMRCDPEGYGMSSSTASQIIPV